MLQKLHSKIKNKCSGLVTDILPHDIVNSHVAQNSGPAECYAMVHALYVLHVVWTYCHSIFTSRPKSSKNMHLYHAVVCRKQFCSGFWTNPWDYMDIRYPNLTVSGTPV